MKQKVDNILECLGETPLVRLRRIPDPGSASVLVKFEAVNIGGSIKTRSAYGMVTAAEEAGLLEPDSIIVEYTSGNQGIGLAMVAAVKGYRCKIVMPETMSMERRRIMEAYGAEICLTPAGSNITEAIDLCVARAREMAEDDPKVWLANQFANPANPEIHRLTTGREILEQAGGPVDAFCAGVGTGGTLTGVGRALREANPHVTLVAVEPTKAAVLSGSSNIGHHAMQGMGDGLIPDVLDMNLVDRIILVEDEEALDIARRLAREEGLLCGVSSGANVFAALALARELGEGKTVVTVLPDTGERYLSTDLF